MTSKLLNRRQTRLSEFLSRFKFDIVYHPGNKDRSPMHLLEYQETFHPRGGQKTPNKSCSKGRILTKRYNRNWW
jgi:hypothetical protein